MVAYKSFLMNGFHGVSSRRPRQRSLKLKDGKAREILWRFMKYEWIEFWAYANFACLIQYVEGVIKGFGNKYKIHFG